MAKIASSIYYRSMDYTKYRLYKPTESVGEAILLSDCEVYRFHQVIKDDDNEGIEEDVIFFADTICPHGFGCKKRTVTVYLDPYGKRVDAETPNAVAMDYEVIADDVWSFSYNVEMWSKQTLHRGEKARYTRIDGEDAKLLIYTYLWDILDPSLQEYLLETFPEIKKDLESVGE